MKALSKSWNCLILCFCICLWLYCWLVYHLKGTPVLSKTKDNKVISTLDTNNVSAELATRVRNVNNSREERVLNKRVHTPHHRGAILNPIVTLFTTIRDRNCRKEIHRRLIKNWAALSPGLDPVLFVPSTEKNSSWIDIAISSNWTVRILHALRHNLPIIRAMFKDVLSVSSTPFVGYANADVLFDRSLLATLRYLSESLDISKQMVLIVGRRRNIDIKTIDLGSGDNLTKISQMDNIRPFIAVAQDYFIISRRGLPWDEIPDFVVGRVGYDNWLVAKARDWNITLIDASRTVLALHQCGTDGYNSGFTTVPKKSLNWNIMLAKRFNYARGSTDLTPLYTTGRCISRNNSTPSIYCNQINGITLKRRFPQTKKIKSKIKSHGNVPKN